MNSIACSGQDGVSNAFEAALWATDIMFEYAQVGVSGVNFHTNNWNRFKQWDSYGAFHFDVPRAQFERSQSVAAPPGTAFSENYTLRDVSALYYGILLFAKATPHHANLIPVSVQTRANIKGWATLDPTTDSVNVMIINKDKTASGVVGISVPGYRLGTIKRLIAPSYSAKTGISIAGQTFDGSVDGKPIGTEYGELATGVNGKFEVSVEPTSAVLISLEK